MTQSILENLKLIALETQSTDLQDACKHVANCLSNNSATLQDAIKHISRFILIFENAKLFRKYLSNLVLPLVSEAIPLKAVFSNQNVKECDNLIKLQHLEYCIILSFFSHHPDVLQYALKYLQINPVSPYEVFSNEEDFYHILPKKRRLQSGKQIISALHVVTCCYVFLSKLPNELSLMWDWSQFITDFSEHQDPKIRCETIHKIYPMANSRHLESVI